MGFVSFTDDIKDRVGQLGLPSGTALQTENKKLIDQLYGQLLQAQANVSRDIPGSRYTATKVEAHIGNLLSIIESHKEPIRLAAEVDDLQKRLQNSSNELEKVVKGQEQLGKRYEAQFEREKDKLLRKFNDRLETEKKAFDLRWKERERQVESGLRGKDANQISALRRENHALATELRATERELFIARSMPTPKYQTPPVDLKQRRELQDQINELQKSLKSKTKELQKVDAQTSKFAREKFRDFETLFESRTADLKEETRGLRKDLQKSEAQVRALQQELASRDRRLLELSRSDYVITDLKKELADRDTRIIDLRKEIDRIASENEDLGGKHFAAVMRR